MNILPSSLRYPWGLGLFGKLERPVRVFGGSLDKVRLMFGDAGEEDGRVGVADVAHEGHIWHSCFCAYEAIYGLPCFSSFKPCAHCRFSCLR